MPERIIIKMAKGIIKLEKKRINFIEPAGFFYNICKTKGKNSKYYYADWRKCDIIIRIGEFFESHEKGSFEVVIV